MAPNDSTKAPDPTLATDRRLFGFPLRYSEAERAFVATLINQHGHVIRMTVRELVTAFNR